MILPGIQLSEVTINPLTCTGLMTHDVRGPEGVEDVASIVGEGGGGGVEVSADVDLDLEQRLQGADNLPDPEPGDSLEVAGDRQRGDLDRRRPRRQSSPS